MTNVHKKKERNTGLGSGTREGNPTTIAGTTKSFGWQLALRSGDLCGLLQSFHNSFHFDDSPP